MKEILSLSSKLTVNQRIKNVREFNNLSQEKFAEIIGSTRGTVAQIEYEKQKAPLDVIQSIVKIYNIPYEDLIEGVEEEKAKKGKNLSLQASSQNVSQQVSHQPGTGVNTEAPGLILPNAEIITVTIDTNGNPVIPILDIQAAAGLPANINNAQYFSTLPAQTMPWVQFKTGEYVLLQVSGDSMQPTIYHGDWLYCRRLYDYKDIRDGFVHVVVTSEGVVAKRVLNRIDKRNSIALQSDNTQYATYDLKAIQILQIWRVELKMSAILRNEMRNILREVDNLQKEIVDVKDRLSALES